MSFACCRASQFRAHGWLTFTTFVIYALLAFIELSVRGAIGTRHGSLTVRFHLLLHWHAAKHQETYTETFSLSDPNSKESKHAATTTKETAAQ
jgi:hypothetical protein